MNYRIAVPFLFLLGNCLVGHSAQADPPLRHDKQGASVGRLAGPAKKASIPLATFETFESYTLGQLAPQGGWFNFSDTNDRVVNGPFSGKAGRHFASGANSGSLQVISWDFPNASYYGDFSLDVLISGGGTTYAVGICDDFVKSNCSYHNNLTFALDGRVFSSNDMNATSTWSPGTPVRIGWRVAADSSVLSFVGGRAFSLAGSEAAIVRGTMTPMSVLVTRSANEGVGMEDGSGDTLTIDNISSDNVAIIDPAGVADLLHGASLGPYANTMATRRWPSWIATTGETFPWYLFALNSSAIQSSESAFVATLPAHLSPTASCGGGLVGSVFTTNSQSIAPNAVASCELTLTATQVGDFPVTSAVAPTTSDPFAPNDNWSGIVGVRDPLPGQRCRSSGGMGCPSNIGESAGSTTSSTMTVSGCPSVTDINVGIAINHTYSGDLTITLQPPTGGPVTIVNEACSASRFYHLQTVIDDDAGSILGSSCPAQGRAPAQPQSSLASGFAGLQGVAGDGVWTLSVSDAYNQDGGVLDDWSLALSCTGSLFANGFE